MKVFLGQTASAGFAFGPVLILKNKKISYSAKKSEGPEKETALFHHALKKSTSDLVCMKELSQAKNKVQSVEILEAHLMLLEDPEAIDQTVAKIQSGISAEVAYFSVIEEFRKMFLQVQDDLIRQRAVDLQDICERVLFYLQKPTESFPDLSLHKPTILIAEDLTPSQIFGLDKSKLLGFVTVQGSGTSHTAILARSLEIPAIVGADRNILELLTDQEVGLNSESGQLIANVSDTEKVEFLQKKSIFEKKIAGFTAYKGQPSKTLDDVHLTLASNISGPQDLESFSKNDAEAVGLYRTEFLFLDRESAPTEDEQYKIYKEVFVGLKNKPLLIRTLDIGGDKIANYLNMKHEENPFLGIRALRLCFERPKIFITQLRALLRAGANTEHWGLMFPMVSQLEELNQAKAFVDEAKQQLEKEGTPYCKNFKIGIMVEIPSAAWMINALAKHVDFISIGTNDLLQYTCAADRLNPDLKSVYNPYNIGFLNQIHHVLKTCGEQKVHTGICGSLSHHPDLMPFFIGCGVNELSMSSQHILQTRAGIQKLNFKKCQNLVQQVLSCSTHLEVKEIFKNFALANT